MGGRFSARLHVEPELWLWGHPTFFRRLALGVAGFLVWADSLQKWPDIQIYQMGL
jgi:hypothetical protein